MLKKIKYALERKVELNYVVILLIINLRYDTQLILILILLLITLT